MAAPVGNGGRVWGWLRLQQKPRIARHHRAAVGNRESARAGRHDRRHEVRRHLSLRREGRRLRRLHERHRDHELARHQRRQPVHAAVVRRGGLRHLTQDAAAGDKRAPVRAHRDADDRLALVVHDDAADGGELEETNRHVRAALAVGEIDRAGRAGRAEPPVRAVEVSGARRVHGERSAPEIAKRKVPFDVGDDTSRRRDPGRTAPANRRRRRRRAAIDRHDRARNRPARSGVDHCPDDETRTGLRCRRCRRWRRLLRQRRDRQQAERRHGDREARELLGHDGVRDILDPVKGDLGNSGNWGIRELENWRIEIQIYNSPNL